MHDTNHVDRSLLASINTLYYVKLLIVSCHTATITITSCNISTTSEECVFVQSDLYKGVSTCPVDEVVVTLLYGRTFSRQGYALGIWIGAYKVSRSLILSLTMTPLERHKKCSRDLKVASVVQHMFSLCKRWILRSIKSIQRLLVGGLNGWWVYLINCIAFPLYYTVLCYYYIVRLGSNESTRCFFYASAVWQFIFVLRGTIAGPPPPSLQCPACSFIAQGFCSEPMLLMPRGWDECLRSNRCVTDIQIQLCLNGLFSFEKFLLLNPAQSLIFAEFTC